MDVDEPVPHVALMLAGAPPIPFPEYENWPAADAPRLVAAAIKRMDAGLLTAVLDQHAVALDEVPSSTLLSQGRAPPGYHILCTSGGCLHMVVSMMRFQVGGDEQLQDPPTRQPILARLLQAGASVHRVDDDGLTPLHWACQVGLPWAIEQLIAHGAPVTAADASGNTPLHQLCRPSKLASSLMQKLGDNAVGRMLTPLLDAGADPTAPRKDGLYPYDLLSSVRSNGRSAVRAARAGKAAVTRAGEHGLRLGLEQRRRHRLGNCGLVFELGRRLELGCRSHGLLQR